MVLLCSCVESQAQTTPSKEYQIKAVFLYNFTQFVEWHPAAFQQPTAPFVIGILGEDPFGNYIDQTVAGENVGGRPIIVRRYKEAKDINSCHILFINSTTIANDVLKVIASRNILTVGDNSNFIRQGGIVRFYTDNNKIRLQINLTAARTANLNISSKLLRVADVVGK